ncbi:MAG: hypothetical protein HYX76_11475 [Acidobacteria bacterium]|nr:hypothetical protein [Acidobacteriota bacterium]
MRKRIWSLVPAFAALASLVVTAQPANIFGRNAKLGVQPLQGPSGRFNLEYPKKDWQAVPGGGFVLVTLAQKKGEAAIVVEHATLNIALTAADIDDVFAQTEADLVRERQVAATNVTAKLLDVGPRRLILVEFGRPGIKGAERVRQYSFPVGTDLYRLICSSAVAQFTKFEPVFAHVAASFTIVSRTE